MQRGVVLEDLYGSRNYSHNGSGPSTTMRVLSTDVRTRVPNKCFKQMFKLCSFGYMDCGEHKNIPIVCLLFEHVCENPFTGTNCLMFVERLVRFKENLFDIFPSSSENCLSVFMQTLLF